MSEAKKVSSQQGSNSANFVNAMVGAALGNYENALREFDMPSRSGRKESCRSEE